MARHRPETVGEVHKFRLWVASLLLTEFSGLRAAEYRHYVAQRVAHSYATTILRGEPNRARSEFLDLLRYNDDWLQQLKYPIKATSKAAISARIARERKRAGEK